MPGGLPSVEQKFSADASAYIAGVAAMIKANKDLVDDIRRVKAEIDTLGAARVIKIDADTRGAMTKIAALKTELGGLGDKKIKIEADGLAQVVTDAKAARAAIGGIRSKKVKVDFDMGSALTDLAALKVALDALDGGKLAALAALRGRGGGAAGWGPGGGGGYGAAAAAAAAGGGGGGGGGGAWGAFSPLGSGGGQALRFWGMAIAEFAATAVPALVAAGAASMVGMQGAQEVMNRARAISVASESIGPAYGQSTATYLGTPGTLSRYQDMARGGVYELAGAGINFSRLGRGEFSQLGLSTLSMIDRGTANMLINYRNRQQAGGGLGGLLGGGTEWLRRYGDLFSNLGDTVMNLAPYEPGLGGDVLNTLVGGTGFLKQMTQDIPGPILGAIMAAEGGARWGKAILGGKGLLGRVLGLRKVGGLGGLLGKGGEALFTRGAGGIMGDLGLGMIGAGDALAGAAGPISMAAALAAFGFSELAGTMPSPAQRQMAALQESIGKAGFSGAWQPLAHAIVTSRGLAATAPGGIAAMMGTNQSPGSFARFGQIGPTTAQVYASAAQGFGQTMTDLINAGPQLVAALKHAGLKSVSMGDAFQIAQNALLDLPHAFGKDGKLNKTAVQMLENYASGIAPMTRSGGAFNAAIAAGQIMGSPQMKALSQVNQAMDSMTQIMTAGPAGMATLFGMLGGTPTTTKHGGLKLQASPAMAKMAQALTSFTTPAGAAAWNTFAGSQGFIAAEQQNLDQLRTAMTLGAIDQRGAAGLAGFQIQQILPMARRSPAALAMLMQQQAQMGIGGYYDPSKTQGQNYSAAVAATAKIADNARQANQAMNSMTVNLSNLPAMAKQFSQGFNADVMSKQVAQAASSFSKITSEAKHGILDRGAIASLAGQLKTAFGGNMSAVRAQIQQALSTSGLSAGMQRKIMIQVDANIAAAKAKLSQIDAAKLHNKQFTISANNGPAIAAIARAVAAAEGMPNVTRTITYIVRMIGTVTGTPGGVPLTAAGIAAQSPALYTKPLPRQTGGLVPGSGHGDIIPAMLEPGEAIVPRNLVPLIAPFLASHHVPGFGGMPQSSASHFAAGGIVPHVLGFPDPTIQGKSGQFAFTLIDELAKALKSAGARKIADALVAQIGKEITYAKNVASAAMHGQGYGDPGLFGMFTAPPKGAGGPVYGPNSGKFNAAAWNAYVAGFAADQPAPKSVKEQMQDYLHTVRSFSGDIGKLRKQHLNKDIIAQLIGAGPEQGDAFAQSILSTGAGGINKLWHQLGSATKGLGAQAAMSEFGGFLAPNLKSGSFTSNHVTININAPGGRGSLDLTPAQIKKLVEQIQAALLKQARRNNKTGIQAQGKGA